MIRQVSVNEPVPVLHATAEGLTLYCPICMSEVSANILFHDEFGDAIRFASERERTAAQFFAFDFRELNIRDADIPRVIHE